MEEILYIAIMRGSTETFEKLLQDERIKQVDLNAALDRGYKPLHLIVINQDEYKLRLILKCEGININALDNEGNTALHLAINLLDPSLAIIKILVEAGINIKQKNNQKETFEILFHAKYPEAERLLYEIKSLRKPEAKPKIHKKKPSSTGRNKSEDKDDFEDTISCFGDSHSDANCWDSSSRKVTVGNQTYTQIREPWSCPTYTCGTNPDAPGGILVRTSINKPYLFGEQREESSVSCFSSNGLFSSSSRKKTTNCFSSHEEKTSIEIGTSRAAFNAEHSEEVSNCCGSWGIKSQINCAGGSEESAGSEAQNDSCFSCGGWEVGCFSAKEDNLETNKSNPNSFFSCCSANSDNFDSKGPDPMGSIASGISCGSCGSCGSCASCGSFGSCTMEC